LDQLVLGWSGKASSGVVSHSADISKTGNKPNDELALDG